MKTVDIVAPANLETKNVFIIMPAAGAGAISVYSNRKLIYRWMKEHQAFIRIPGKQPKQITSYETLCRLWQEKHILQLIVLDPVGIVEYNLLRAPVINK